MAWCRQATSHYLNQCWPRSLPPFGVTRPQWVNWNIRKKFQWNSNRNSNLFIEENALENVVCEMASILSWPRCVNICQYSYLPWSAYRTSYNQGAVAPHIARIQAADCRGVERFQWSTRVAIFIMILEMVVYPDRYVGMRNSVNNGECSYTALWINGATRMWEKTFKYPSEKWNIQFSVPIHKIYQVIIGNKWTLVNSSPPSAAFMRQWTGLSPVRHQTITWTNAGLLPGNLVFNSLIFTHESAFETSSVKRAWLWLWFLTSIHCYRSVGCKIVINYSAL